MSSRALGWLIGGAVMLTLFAGMPACGSDSTDNTAGQDSGVSTVPEGGLADVTPTPASDGSADSGGDADDGATIAPPACNDGKVDLGETCDPLTTCPTDCPQSGCQLRTLDNAGTCTAVCDDVALQTQCLNGDGCCPPGCNTKSDSDCQATCGNGVVEQGETCDGDCPTSCPTIGCQTQKIQTTGGNACTATCVADQTITTCDLTKSDNCCPTGCGATDLDCGVGACGNGVLDNGETCDDGLGTTHPCPKSCPANGCSLQKLQNQGTCQAQCVDAGQITTCGNGDACCPSGCNANNDAECKPVCGNGVIESGETCDNNCPTSCPQKGCQEFTLQNNAPCNVTCVPGQLQTQCVNADHCCPKGCTASTDSDCANVGSLCGNGVVDPGETCDGNCPTCPAPPYTSCYATKGSAATCDLVCNAPIETCSGSARDSCCPLTADGGSCSSATDQDCVGPSWQYVGLPAQLTIAAGTCVPMTATNIVQSAAYEITTCAPSVGTVGTQTGNTRISKATQQTGSPTGGNVTTYAVANDDCTDASALPRLAGWSCNNAGGQLTMACASPDSGGFTVTSASPLQWSVCAVGDGAKVQVYLFYNAAGPAPVLAVGAPVPTP